MGSPSGAHLQRSTENDPSNARSDKNECDCGQPSRHRESSLLLTLQGPSIADTRSSQVPFMPLSDDVGTKESAALKNAAVVFAVLLCMSGQTPAPAPTPLTHLEYRFGYHTDSVDEGPGTGTLSVDIYGLQSDGGVLVSGQDYWWDSVRPRATNTCEVYANGSVACTQRPYDLAWLQADVFPLLGREFFSGLSTDPQRHWQQHFTITRGNLDIWRYVFDLHAHVPVSKSEARIPIDVTETGADERYSAPLKPVLNGVIVYDPIDKVPVSIHYGEVRLELTKLTH
jgi:hypothetical protein